MANYRRAENVPESFTERNVIASIPRLSQYQQAQIMAMVSGYLFSYMEHGEVTNVVVQKAYAYAFAASGSPLTDAGELRDPN